LSYPFTYGRSVLRTPHCMSAVTCHIVDPSGWSAFVPPLWVAGVGSDLSWIPSFILLSTPHVIFRNNQTKPLGNLQENTHLKTMAPGNCCLFSCCMCSIATPQKKYPYGTLSMHAVRTSRLAISLAMSSGDSVFTIFLKTTRHSGHLVDVFVHLWRQEKQ